MGDYYIDSIKIRGFKSFKKADVQFVNGFVALAGPNGCGKSNLVDSIRFSLGELGLKSLRAKKSADLIHSGSNEIKVTLEVGGKKKYKFQRAVTSDGKTKYKVNDKTTTRTTMIDTLRPLGLELDSHNVLAQGQVQKITEMNSKERRAIIDSASGISEFEEKKKEAMRELGKVEQRINDTSIIMSEREGYLRELEKEKNNAIAYIESRNTYKSARASLINIEIVTLEKDYDNIIKQFTELKINKQKLKSQIEDLETKIKNYETEKATITSEINKRGGKDNALKLLEQLRIKINVDLATVKEKQQEMIKLNKTIETLKNDEKDVLSNISILNNEIIKIKNEIETLSKKIGPDIEIKIQSVTKDLKINLEKLQENMSNSREIKSKFETELTNLEEMLKMKADDLKEYSDDGDIDIEKLQTQRDNTEDEIIELRKTIEGMFTEEKRINKELPDYDRNVLRLKEEVAILRPQVSRRISNPALILVDELKNKYDGIHGTVSELIDFDNDYAEAIQGASGGRLNYVIVDDSNVAKKMIDELKRRKAGRCTFIPLDRIVSRNEIETSKLSIGLGSLINYVKFQPEYINAMSYVFGTTILINDFNSAKTVGVNKKRMVTMGGEVFETSGIITGGKSKSSINAQRRLEKVEKELDVVLDSRQRAYDNLNDIRNKMSDKRRERSGLEIKIRGIEVELQHFDKTGNKSREKIIKLKQSIEDIKQQSQLKKAKLETIITELNSITKQIENIKQEIITKEQKETDELSKAQKKYAKELSRLSELKAIHDGKNNELDMINQNLNKIKEQYKTNNHELTELKKQVDELNKNIKKNQAEEKIESNRLKEISKEMESLWEKHKVLGKEISVLAESKGKLIRENEKVSSTLQQLEIKKATTETKLGDMKAEFEDYHDIKLIEHTPDILREMIKKSENIMNSIGDDVNLKAPEVYEEKKKEIDEVKTRIEQLNNEKDAVFNMIKEIDTKKKTIFLNVFHAVNEKFKELYGKITSDEEAFLILDKPSTPFEGGLRLKVRGKGKKDKYLVQMSGGEKTLLSIVFIMAIQMVKPSPLYLLDEVDAALDKSNSKKLALLIRKMADDSQFIVVTHNDTVLKNADVALGVSKVNDESKVIGLKLTEKSMIKNN